MGPFNPDEFFNRLAGGMEYGEDPYSLSRRNQVDIDALTPYARGKFKGELKKRRALMMDPGMRDSINLMTMAQAEQEGQ